MHRKAQNGAFLAVALLLVFAVTGNGGAQTHWLASWAASQQLPVPHNSLAAGDLRDATLRQVVHISIGRPQLRVHLSNRFGMKPLHLASVRIASPVSLASGTINVSTDKSLTFSGRLDVTIPAEAEYVSDPVAFPLAALSDGDHLHPSPAGYAAIADAVPLSLFASASSAVAASPRMAITFDDLPAHGPLPPGETRLEVSSKIIAALREAHVPPIYGFVNGQRVEQQPADAAVLQAWRAAGYPLGNHAWSHMGLNEHAVEEFEADVSRNEPLLSEWMKSEDWHWFRFPFLAEGDTPEKRSAVRSFLLQRGYKVAAVTMTFEDYLWNEPYARCRAKNDAAAIALLETSYLEAANGSVTFYRDLSNTLYGRDIPYVLLMHFGAFDAAMLPKLLSLYRSLGFEFITLPEAEKDQFYLMDIDLRLAPGANMLERVMAERHLPLPSRKAPSVQLDSVCR